MVECDTGQSDAMQSSAAVTLLPLLILLQLQYTPQQRLAMLFSGPYNPQIFLLPIGGSGCHKIHVSLGPSESAPQRASRSVLVSLMGPTDQTHRRTDRPRYSNCSNRPHLATAVMLLNNDDDDGNNNKPSK